MDEEEEVVVVVVFVVAYIVSPPVLYHAGITIFVFLLLPPLQPLYTCMVSCLH